MIEQTEIYEQWQQDLLEPEAMWIPQLLYGVAAVFFGVALGMWLAS